MATKIRLDELPAPIKKQLIRKLLSSADFQDVTRWLLEKLLYWEILKTKTPAQGGAFFGLNLNFGFSQITELRKKIKAIGHDEAERLLLALMTHNNSEICQATESEVKSWH